MADVLPTVEQRVEKGIAWLEEQGAWDWAEKIVAAVDAREFDMRECTTCAVGVTLGDFVDYWAGGLEESAVRGFEHGILYQPPGASGMAWRDMMDADYRALEVEWERQARQRLAWGQP